MTYVIEHIKGSVNDLRNSEYALTRSLRHELELEARISVLIKRTRLRLRLQQLEGAWEDICALHELPIASERLASVLELEADYYLAIFEWASVGFADQAALRRATTIYNSILESADNSQMSGWIHYQLGRCYMLLMDFQLAVQEFHQALVLPGDRSHPELTSYCYERLGYITYYEYRNPSEALLYLERSLDTYPNTADTLWQVPVYLLYARVLRELYALEDALRATRLALAIATRIGEKSLIAESLLLLSDLLAKTHDNNQEIINVITNYMQFKMRPIGVDLTWGSLNDLLGDAYAHLWQYNNAIEAYQDALYFNPDHLSEAQIQLKIVCCYYQLKQYKQVVESVMHLLNVSKKENYIHIEGSLYELLGNACFALKQYQAAINAYEKSISLDTFSQSNRSTLYAYMTIASLNLKNGNSNARA